MISKLKRLEIANCMYANVAGQFAEFTNEANRPPHFTWEWFIRRCGEQADLWLMIYSGKKATEEQAKLATEYAKEIAQTLVWHLQK